EVADGLARVRDAGQFQLHLELALLEACARVGEQPRTMPDTAGPPSRLERAESQTHQGAAPESTETFPGPADLPRQFKHEGDVAAESAPGRPQADAAAGE